MIARRRLRRLQPRRPAISSSFTRFDSGISSLGAVRAHADVVEIRVASRAVLGAALEHHVVLPAAIDVGRDVARAQHRLERASRRLRARRRGRRRGRDRRARASAAASPVVRCRRCDRPGFSLRRAATADVAPLRELVVVRAAEHDLHGRLPPLPRRPRPPGCRRRTPAHARNALRAPRSGSSAIVLRRALALAPRLQRDMHDAARRCSRRRSRRPTPPCTRHADRMRSMSPLLDLLAEDVLELRA